MAAERFPSPFEIETPAGAEGWQDMYSYYHVLSEDRRDLDEQRFWFQDQLHHGDVLYPYDEIQCECWWPALGAFNTRIFAMPPAFGVDQRVINGYLYISPVPVDDPAKIPERAEIYKKRAGYYYENWNELYERWKVKTVAALDRIKAIEFAPLPDLEDEEVVFSARGYSTSYRMVHDFGVLVDTMYETYQYHFEFLNIGYAAYLTYFGFCKQAFPDISDQAIARMVGGLAVDLYRPDDELKRLAKRAVELGIAGKVAAAADAESLWDELRADGPGAEWIADYERTSDPWFLVSLDPGHPGGYHNYGTWQDDPTVPLSSIQGYIRQLEADESIDRPTEQVLAERDRIAGEYRALLDEAQQKAFDEILELARLVFVYIEEHVLYIEHWLWSTFWNKSRELAATLQQTGVFEHDDDMFFLNRHEVAQLLYDVHAGWSVGSRWRGSSYWGPVVEQRRKIYETLKQWSPPPALGAPPEEVTEPFTVMLWGITTERVKAWLAAGEDGAADGGKTLSGAAASPGTVEGVARVVRAVSELGDVRQGEILVCPATSPAWAPIFPKISAVVSDVGGMMSHTAIVCREYGLPAVVGTGYACATIESGQRVRVDGSSGTVTILE